MPYLIAIKKGAVFAKSRRVRVKDPNLMATEDRLQRVFGTKVKIVGSPKKGKIEVDYYSHDELERLLDLMVAMEPKS